MSEIVSSIDFEAPIETAFETICDFKAYPKFLETIKSAKVLDQNDHEAVVEFSLELLKKFDYTIKLSIDGPNYVEWNLIQADVMKKNDGSWRLTKTGPKSTHAVYTVDIDFGIWVPAPIKKFLIESSIPATLNSFKSEIEKRASKGTKASTTKAGKKK